MSLFVASPMEFTSYFMLFVIWSDSYKVPASPKNEKLFARSDAPPVLSVIFSAHKTAKFDSINCHVYISWMMKTSKGYLCKQRQYDIFKMISNTVLFPFRPEQSLTACKVSVSSYEITRLVKRSGCTMEQFKPSFSFSLALPHAINRLVIYTTNQSSLAAVGRFSTP